MAKVSLIFKAVVSEKLSGRSELEARTTEAQCRGSVSLWLTHTHKKWGAIANLAQRDVERQVTHAPHIKELIK
jgi:hypothetical protein